MKAQKRKLIKISDKFRKNTPLTPQEIKLLQTFEHKNEDNRIISFLKLIAFPASLLAGAAFVIWAEYFDTVVKTLPSWTNLSPSLLAGIDFIWDFIGEPIGRANIIYHIPNIILYTFGIAGIKTLIDTIEHRTWLEKVLQAQTALIQKIQIGKLDLYMKSGHSLLFIGKSDFIGMQFALNHKDDEVVTIAQHKPSYTNIWNYYDISTLYEDLEDVILRSDGSNVGEYVFFPVKDDQIFLPGDTAYDLSPHKLDLIAQDIRIIEKDLKLKPKRMIIIGDKFHKSFVQSEDEKSLIQNSEDTISLESISKKYKKVTLVDPSDIVVKRIIEIAQGRKIVFRATKDGLKEYKTRFYERLKNLGYKTSVKAKGILTIGYDIFEDQTEQQTLARAVDDYYPVVLSKSVRDSLIRNGYKKSEFIYVPDLVLKELAKITKEQ
ncbi:MAG: hypothetical protein ACEQSA_06020 [Weeksellaceae bacterium]